MELHIRDISKTYSNGVQALKDVTLTIPAGMYGLLGPNGVGKSTLMRILATLQEPDEGSVRLGDTDVLNQKDEVRKTLGYLPQEFGVYPKVSAESLLDHFAVLKGIAGRRARKEVVEELLRQTKLVGGAQAEARRLLGRHAAALRCRRGAPGQSDADDRGRTDSRPRPGRARAFSEPAERAGREQRRPPLDPYRRGRDRAVHPDGTHRPGGDPARSRAPERGRRPPGPDLAPGPVFEPSEPDLKDVYFSALAGHIGRRREHPEPALAS